MLEKIINVSRSRKAIYLAAIISLICMLIVTLVSYDTVIKPIITYPESDYLLLEEEAKKYLANNDLESEYLESIVHNIKDNSLRIYFEKGEAVLIVNIDDYEEVGQSITINRFFSKGSYAFYGTVKCIGWYISGSVLIAFLIFGVIKFTGWIYMKNQKKYVNKEKQND